MVPFVFSILPCRKQQLVLSLASISCCTAVAASIFLHSAFYVLSHPIPVRSLEKEAATLQSRSAVPSSPLLSSPLSSFFPNSPAYFSASRLASVSFGRGERERRGESGGTTERGGNVYYVRDGAKSKMGRRSGRLPPAGERASDRTARDKRERASSGQTNQPSFFPLAKCRLRGAL